MVEKFKRKPLELEGIQFFDDAQILCEIQEFTGETIGVDYADKDNPVLKITTPIGIMTANVGDYIIKDDKGEIWNYSKEIFEEAFTRL